MHHSGTRIAAIAMTALAMAGCSGNASKPLTTGSLAPPAVVDDSSTRLSQAAWTSARADKCGFVIDQAKLKSSYLAYEAAQTPDPAALAKIEKAFDAVRNIMVKKITPKPDYCSTAVVEDVRRTLADYLNGNFAARAVKVSDSE